MRQRVARKSRIAAMNTGGLSPITECPAPAITARRLPGIDACSLAALSEVKISLSIFLIAGKMREEMIGFIIMEEHEHGVEKESGYTKMSRHE